MSVNKKDLVVEKVFSHMFQSEQIEIPESRVRSTKFCLGKCDFSSDLCTYIVQEEIKELRAAKKDNIFGLRDYNDEYESNCSLDPSYLFLPSRIDKSIFNSAKEGFENSQKLIDELISSKEVKNKRSETRNSEQFKSPQVSLSPSRVQMKKNLNERIIAKQKLIKNAQ